MSKNRSSFSKRDRERRKAEKHETKRLRREERRQSVQEGESPVPPDAATPEAADGSQTPPAAI